MEKRKQGLASRSPEAFIPHSTRLLDQVREILRYHHYAWKTEQSYVRWIVRFIRFNGTGHPRELGKHEIERFLSHLAVNRNVAVATQNQALIAMVFLYRQVLQLPITDNLAVTQSKKPVRLPTVLSRDEVSRLLAKISLSPGLMARLMYGGGLRLNEVLTLRVQDIDFGQGLLMIRNGKGGKDRSTLLPASLFDPLKVHLEKVRSLYEQDVSEGKANVWLPGALARKYPHAPRSWEWQWVFPSANLSADPQTGELRRHHVHESGVQKAIRRAKQKAGINKRVTSHTLRHSFATHLLEQGINIRVVQKLLGHADVKTTEIYTHVLQQNLNSVVSPLETLTG